jgi:hypothetical protein
MPRPLAHVCADNQGPHTRKPPHSVGRMLWLTAIAVALAGCAGWRQDVYTISPAVKESARRYSDVMDDFADQVLLANVLRARDSAPLNFNDFVIDNGFFVVFEHTRIDIAVWPLTGTPTSSNSYKNSLSPGRVRN